MNKVSTWLKVFSLSFLFLSEYAHAAYLVYQYKDGEKPKPLEEKYQEEAFNIIDANSWPNNLADIKKLDVKSLPYYVTRKEPGTEKKYIEQKLQNALNNPHIYLQWVPTTLFQMVGLPVVIETVENEEESKMFSARDYFKTNEIMVNFLFENSYKNILENSISGKNFDELIVFFEKSFDGLTKNHNVRLQENFKVFCDYKSDHSSALKEVFKIEIMAYLRNEFTLYRTSTNISYESELGKKNTIDTIMLSSSEKICVNPRDPKQAYGISIANTLLAGWGDTTACTFRIFCGFGSSRSKESGAKNLYALNIEKESFVKNYKDILYWPRSNPIADLYAQSEYFHPRTFGKVTKRISGKIYKPERIIISEELFEDKFFDMETEKNKSVQLVKESICSYNNKLTTNNKSILNYKNEVENYFEGKLDDLNKEGIELLQNLTKLKEELAVLNNPETGNQYITQMLKDRFLNENSELELVLLLTNFLRDYMKVIYDGKTVVEHKVTETEHPHNELYNNQIEMGQLIYKNSLVYNDHIMGRDTEKGRSLVEKIKDLEKVQRIDKK